MGALQPGHLIVVLVIVLLIFGPGKLPELGKAVGDGLRELKKATGGDSEAKDGATHPATTSTATGVTTTAAATNGAVSTEPCSRCQAAVPVSDKFCGVCGNAMEPTPHHV